MTAIFVSHRSTDATDAGRIKDWLKNSGHKLLFLSSDPEDGIAAGADWEHKVYGQLQRCQAVLIVLTPDWLASKWCFAELVMAREKGKPIFVAKLKPCPGGPLIPALQEADLTADREAGLWSLARGLKEHGLDPSQPFDWNPDRPIYPGLDAFDEEDAAILFGRREESQAAMQALRRLRLQGREARHLLLITGASGSGKSSLMRAGVLPLLRQEPHNWLRVRPFRCGIEPIKSLAEKLAAAFAEHGGKRASDQLARELLADVGRPGATENGNRLVTLAHELRDLAGRPEATVLLALDQGEELVGGQPAANAAHFFGLLAGAFAKAGNALMMIVTIRSDMLATWQNHPAIAGAGSGLAFELFSLGPVVLDRISEIVRGPARYIGLNIEDDLVDAVGREIGTGDALPLLAFTLQQLHVAHRGDGPLKHAEYQALGGLEGSVRNAANRAIRLDRLEQADLAALRSVFIPGLVRIVEGRLTRQPLPLRRVPPLAKPLIDELIEARLVKSDRASGGQETIEIAHEALIRAWPVLGDWLKEDMAKLSLLAGLRHAAAEWQAGEQRADLLAHREQRLAEIEVLQHDDRFRLAPGQIEHVYFEACRAAERAMRRKRIRAVGSWGAAALFAIVAALVSYRLYVNSVETKATAIWNGLAVGEDDRLTSEAVGQIWRLAEAGSGVRGEVLDQLAQEPVALERFVQRPEPIIRAFGLVPSEPSVQSTLASMMAELRANAPSDRIRDLAKAVRQVPITLSAEQAQQTVATLLAIAAARLDLADQSWETQALTAIAQSLAPDQAAAAIAPVLRAFHDAPDQRRALVVGAALPVLAGRLGPEAARATLPGILAELRAAKDSSAVRVLAQAVQALNVDLTVQQADDATDKAFAGLEAAPQGDPVAVAPLFEKLGPNLLPEQARAAFDPIFAALIVEREGERRSALDRALRALPITLGDDEAEAALRQALDSGRRQDGLQVIETLARKLAPEQALMAFARVLDTAADTGRWPLDALAATMKSLAQRLKPGQATALLPPLLEKLETNAGAIRLRVLAQAVAALPIAMAPVSAHAALKVGLATLQSADTSQAIADAAAALQALASKVPQEEQPAAVNLVLAASREKWAREPERSWAFVSILASLAPAMNERQRSAALDLLLEQLRNADPVRLSDLAKALQALAPRLTAAQRADALAPILEALQHGPNPALLSGLVRAAQALSAGGGGWADAPSGLAEAARKRLADATSARESEGWVAVAEMLLRDKDTDVYVTDVVELLKFPMVAGPPTAYLLDRLRERFADAPGSAAGLAATVAWLGQHFPSIDLARRPSRPT